MPVGKRIGEMSDTITITFKDGKQWRIHRSILDSMSIKKEDELLSFFKRFFCWFSEREKDVLMSLIRMEKEGILIKNNIDIKFR